MGVIAFEDEHLLAVNKPAGWNTHSPAPFAGEGLYEWLRDREPRWSGLSIIHRLDKATSGLIVFGKTAAANRSLTRQFETGAISKKYLLLTDRKITFQELHARSALVRSGEKYLSRPVHAGATIAETVFQPVGTMIEAAPLTGKTHQIRVHAAEHGFPILGDALYGGSSAARLCLHAAQLTFEHPASGQTVTLSAPVDFGEDSRFALREAVIDPAMTDAFRVVHGAADGSPGLYIDRLGEYLLAQSAAPLSGPEKERVEQCALRLGSRAVYHKILQHEERAGPRCLWGTAAPGEISIRENGVRFALQLDEGYSSGLFLDQRDNRRRLLTRHVAADFDITATADVLNTFAYTCGFSVCAAMSGARVTSLDLSKNYLEWGRRNFTLNGIDPGGHDFIFGDAFNWLRRLAKKKSRFDFVLLDPPTFSRSKESGIFQAERDYGTLVSAALSVLKPGGILFASTNAAQFKAEDFLASVTGAIERAGRRITLQNYASQPPDFPIERDEPAYLKTIWLRVG
ncbi:MAG TPA: class I SAM-dependent methyltransferase [Verrucomicrobiae bacterium]|jgi:23S rRNA (cytosine1962-C5)-methyltransferase|nr:class I SAM-dependent methyltransferase [Verrucomicrobiae bacterium]